MDDVAVIIVTYNSEKHINKCIDCLQNQTFLAKQIILVDSGSEEYSYLQKYLEIPGLELFIAEKGVGFCKGNNIGLTKLQPEINFVLFLNPDAFLTPTFLEKAVSFMKEKGHSKCGALTGTTLGYSIEKDSPTGLYDTTGIFHHWWGRWYDRAQGLPNHEQLYNQIEKIPAICGAVFFCRLEALKSIALNEREYFDNSFYMYKEDIDLSLRLKSRGWQLMFVPQLVSFHCRGWNPNRKAMAKKMRLHSVKNELTIHWRQKRPLPIAYSAIKYCLVKYFNV